MLHSRNEAKVLAPPDGDLMGDSYRHELKTKKKGKSDASQAVVREGAAGRAKVREQYFRKSSAGRRAALKAETQKRMM